MNISDTQEGYKILSLAFNKRIKVEEIEQLYEEFYCNLEKGRFVQACRNIAKGADRFPSVAMVLSEYRNIAQDVEEEPFDTNKIVREPPELKKMREGWEKEKPFSMDRAEEEDEKLPF